MFALVKVHVWDARVEAERVVAAAEGPEVNVMDFLHAFDGEHGASDFFQAQFTRTAFEKDVRGFAQDADARPQHKQSDGEAEERINPVRAGDVNDDRAGDDGDVRKGITEIVDQDAAQIEIAATADERQSDAAVHGESGDGSPDHPALDDGDGSAESFDGFIAEPERK